MNDSPTDTEVLDMIALVLGTTESWDADTIDYVAGLVALVRPHPGSTPADKYTAALIHNAEIEAHMNRMKHTDNIVKLAREVAS